MESNSRELEVHSSREKPSAFEKFETGISSKHTAYYESRLVSKTSKDLTNEYERRSSNRVLRDSEASGSNEAAQKSLLKYSRSRIYDYSGKGKEILQANGVEELNERLKILEVETEAMKQAFIETMEERKKLVNEIYQDFLKIHHRRHFGNQVTEVKVLDRSLIVNPSNEVVDIPLNKYVLLVLFSSFPLIGEVVFSSRF